MRHAIQFLAAGVGQHRQGAGLADETPGAKCEHGLGVTVDSKANSPQRGADPIGALIWRFPQRGIPSSREFFSFLLDSLHKELRIRYTQQNRGRLPGVRGDSSEVTGCSSLYSKDIASLIVHEARAQAGLVISPRTSGASSSFAPCRRRLFARARHRAPASLLRRSNASAEHGRTNR